MELLAQAEGGGGQGEDGINGSAAGGQVKLQAQAGRGWGRERT